MHYVGVVPRRAPGAAPLIAAALPLIAWRSSFAAGNVEREISHRIPRVVDADYEQEQGCCPNHEQRRRVEPGQRQCGGQRQQVSDKRQTRVENPVLQHGLITTGTTRAPGHDCRVDDADKAEQADYQCGVTELLPWRTDDRADQQHGHEVNDVGRSEGGDLLLPAGSRAIGDDRHYHELQPGQRAGRRADDYIKAFPFAEDFVGWHGSKLPDHRNSVQREGQRRNQTTAWKARQTRFEEMPATPFHFGPGLLIKAVAPRQFSVTAYSVAQVVIDIESGYYLLKGDDPVHRQAHTFF